jgi:transposase
VRLPSVRCLLTGLFPVLAMLRLDQVVVCEQQITLVACSVQATARCPLCHRLSQQVHSHYVRMVADVPCAGAAVCVELHGRRFRCRHPGCPRTTFRERLPEFAPYSRRTSQLRARLERLGLALGGRPAARVAQALAQAPWGLSRMSLLRLVHHLPLPVTQTPRVLGVDDWAWRKGRRYGTLLADLERHCPIDLLPDRTAETFATWLRLHPGIEIICRDRGGAYADGARQGAPEATQVADRFHLVKNLGDQLEALLARHDAVLRQAAAVDVALGSPERPAADASAPIADAHGSEALALPLPAQAAKPSTCLTRADAPDPPRPLTREQQQQQERRARRLARYERACTLQAQGMSMQVIAQTLGLARNTVRRFVRAAHFPERQLRTRRSSQLARHESYLRQRWEAGEHNAAQLWRELRAQGFTGAPVMVRRRVTRWRSELRHPGPECYPRIDDRQQRPVSLSTGRFSPRATRWLLLREVPSCPSSVGVLAARARRSEAAGNGAGALKAEERTYLDRLCTTCPAIATARRLVNDFLAALRAGDVAALHAWLATVAQSGLPELQSFAYGLRRDRAAVEAAFRLPWSSGQLEGQINRLKTLKRQMYGRASFALLRQRVLSAA